MNCCDDFGRCTQGPQCAARAQAAQMPAPPHPQPPEEPLLHAQECQCWLAKTVILALGGALGLVLGLLYLYSV